MRGHARCSGVEELLKQSQTELLWIQRQLSIIAARNTQHRHAKGRLRNEAALLPSAGLSVHDVTRLSLPGLDVTRLRALEDRNRALKLEVATLRQEKQQYKALKTKLQDALQEKKRLNLELLSHSLKASRYEQVRSDYDQLRETFSLVTQERDSVQQERSQLRGKLENLEQVLKHMREAAERRERLEAEHEQALAVLTTKQQEIHLLQAQVEAERERDGVVRLLEVKVRDLEQTCRLQSDQFSRLHPHDRLTFRVEADPADAYVKPRTPPSPENKLSRILNGLAQLPGKGDESQADTPLISRLLLRPLPTGGPDRDRPELLSVKPIAVTTTTTSRPGSPRRAAPSEMEDEVISPAPSRSKARYTGQVRLCTARYSYNPYDGPNEHPEAELPLVAGKYLYVYGTMDDDGFYEGELLDGQRGLVPSNFVEFVQDKEKLSILPPAESGDDDLCPLDLASLDRSASLGGLGPAGGSDGSVPPQDGGAALPPCSNGTGGPLDPEDLAEDTVPPPRRITLIKQLARSVIVAWEPPLLPPGWGGGVATGNTGAIGCYSVLVDGEPRATVPYGGRTKSLLEKLDLDGCVHRVSVQCAAVGGAGGERGPSSDELRCTLLVGANVVVAPSGLRVDDIQRDTAELSWLPSNSNYGHTVFLDGAEHAAVRPGRYRLRFHNLSAMTVYKVRVVARPHQVPWQLPLEQREKKEAGVEFCTQAAGPPLPPQEVQVHCGPAPGVLQVRWKPPPLSPSGTSNGASVIGYAVCTKGQKIAEVLYPLADYVSVELTRIQCLEAREVIVRTLSAQGESQDSHVAAIPNNLLVPSHPPPPHPQGLPPHPHPHHGLPPPPLPHPHPHPLPHPQPLILGPGPPQQPLLLPPPPPQPQHRLPLLPHPHPHPVPQRPVSARDLEVAKEAAAAHQAALAARHHGGGGVGVGVVVGGGGGGIPGPPPPPWDPAARSPSSGPPAHMPPPQQHIGHAPLALLEAPPPANRRSPSPQRILPQPRGTLIPDTVAKAIAREAAQRVAAESGRTDRTGLYPEQGHAYHQRHSDEEEEDEEEGYERGRRKGASVDEFLRGSELGRPPQYSHSEEYHSESSRGSDLSDIMEEDEEELYSEMQLEEGRRRNSHNALKNTPSGGRIDRETGRRLAHGGPQPQRRPLMVPSIEITTESNSEAVLSPATEDHVCYGRVARHKTNRRRAAAAARPPYDGYRDRERRSPPYYDESEEPEESFRVFVALFDYDPLSMSPNPDAADEELPFKEGQIIRVYGDKDTDGFYRGEVRGGVGLIPCNMVSEIRAEDQETMDQLIKQGFLPLNTPVDRIAEQNRAGLRRDQVTRRMVALYDYDPRESSPNVDVEAELTFCAGDIMAVFGDIDEDGFYYGEINGHRGLVPSNFLEEVPDDVEVYLTDTPARYPQDEPGAAPPAADAKRVTAETTESAAPPVRAPSPMVRPLLPGTMRPLSPTRGTRAPHQESTESLNTKKKKGLLSKGKKLLKKLSPVK